MQKRTPRMPRPRQHSHPMPLALDQTSQLHVRILSKTTHSTMLLASFYFRVSLACSTAKTTNITKGHGAPLPPPILGKLQHRLHLGFIAIQLLHLPMRKIALKAKGTSAGLLSTHTQSFVPPQLPGPRKATSRRWLRVGRVLPVATLAYGSFKV